MFGAREPPPLLLSHKHFSPFGADLAGLQTAVPQMTGSTTLPKWNSTLGRDLNPRNKAICSLFTPHSGASERHFSARSHERFARWWGGGVLELVDSIICVDTKLD